ncbi:MAG TPA: hypothetical protein VLB50_08335, partial [Ignavibacteriaceae bacterium]|nr:hypothetical protein [Ignavibacteriaceae bacterium]
MRMYLYYSFCRKFISILLLYFVFSGLIFSISGTNYYVDRDANGNGNGTSWANAANTISALNWNNINGGDTVYVSGGTSSSVYDKDILTNAIITNGIVTITKGKDSGHNGRVIFEQSGIPTGSKCSFQL